MVALHKNENKTSTPLVEKGTPFVASVPIQKKLSIGASNDAYEVEADRVADKVVSMGNAEVNVAQSKGSLVQRKCSACSQKEEIQKKSLASSIASLTIQRKGDGYMGGEASSALVQQINNSKGGGHSMDKGTRGFMESRFGADFSNVRIHTNTNAIQMSRGLNAQAFTVGNDIYFNEGRYNPNSTSGKHLLAHELTHTLQQGGDMVDKVIQRRVEKCCRSVQTGNSVLDSMSEFLGLRHCWVKTSTKEAGMGPEDDGPLPSNPIGIKTKITDHSGEQGECNTYNQIDENCVNQKLVIGRSTGRWGPFNNCNTFAHSVIMGCRHRTEPRYLGGGAFMGEDGLVRQAWGAGAF